MNEITSDEIHTAKLSVPGPNCTIRFYRGDNTVGVMDFNGPTLKFTGDADESAKLFIDLLAEKWEARLKKERVEERESCAQILDANAKVCANNDMLRGVLEGNALAIRARGET